jgi:hypothetical protein
VPCPEESSAGLSSPVMYTFYGPAWCRIRQSVPLALEWPPSGRLRGSRTRQHPLPGAERASDGSVPRDVQLAERAYQDVVFGFKPDQSLPSPAVAGDQNCAPHRELLMCPGYSCRSLRADIPSLSLFSLSRSGAGRGLLGRGQ